MSKTAEEKSTERSIAQLKEAYPLCDVRKNNSNRIDVIHPSGVSVMFGCGPFDYFVMGLSMLGMTAESKLSAMDCILLSEEI